MIGSLLLAAATISGVVHDSTGGVVLGAAVVVRSVRRRAAHDDRPGRPVHHRRRPTPATLTLIVRAGGFAEKTRRCRPAPRDLDIVLVAGDAARNRHRHADAHRATSRRRAGERQRPDERGDQVVARRSSPTMCCARFRRSASSAAPAASSPHPTAQGVSLRGIGPSGQSRTLVLLDGMPFNDPFGGWVYWTRVPLVSVDRIEVIDGLDVEPLRQLRDGRRHQHHHEPARRGGRSRSSRSTATESSPKFDFFASDRWNKVGVAVEGSFFNTDGFPIVAPSRARADRHQRQRRLQERQRQGRVHARRDRVSAFVRGGYFTEDRDQRQGRRGQRHPVDDGERRRPGPAAGRQRPPGARVRRLPEVPLQRSWRSPTRPRRATSSAWRPISTCRPTAWAAMAQWSKALGAAERVQRGHRLALGRRRQPGGRVRRRGAHRVIVPPVTQAAIADGSARVRRRRSRASGAFVQDIFTPLPKLVITLSARVDHWRNYDGHNLETTVATGPADRQQQAVASRPRPTPSSARASRRCTTSRIA